MNENRYNFHITEPKLYKTRENFHNHESLLKKLHNYPPWWEFKQAEFGYCPERPEQY